MANAVCSVVFLNGDTATPTLTTHVEGTTVVQFSYDDVFNAGAMGIPRGAFSGNIFSNPKFFYLNVSTAGTTTISNRRVGVRYTGSRTPDDVQVWMANVQPASYAQSQKLYVWNGSAWVNQALIAPNSLVNNQLDSGPGYTSGQSPATNAKWYWLDVPRVWDATGVSSASTGQNGGICAITSGVWYNSTNVQSDVATANTQPLSDWAVPIILDVMWDEI
jgi:hypothetical protein